MPTPTPALHAAARLPQTRTSPQAVRGSHNLTGTIDLMGAPMSFSRNSEIHGENEPADYLYKVISGTVRTYRILNDGRRQIGAFYLPGDIFGLEVGAEHHFSAEAISDAKVLVIKRSALVGLANRDGDVARQLWSFTARELQRAQDHVLLLVKSAQQRVASFLLEMAERLSDGEAVELPMSRQDIADYLGLTIETISRTLTQLELELAIALPTSRRIVLRNRNALTRMNA
jgi:CRP/FNR family transcriptional regulator, nitrogen fixation regulation protein